MKDKNYVIISVDAEKALGKIQYPSVVEKKRTVNKWGKERMHLNTIKAVYYRSQLTS